MNIAYYHLPGLFQFYEFYKAFLKLYTEHNEYFYEWCRIGSIYGSPLDCIWGGGRIEEEDVNPKDVLHLMNKYHISSRLTFSNCLLKEEHLNDYQCNELCKLFNDKNNGIIIYSNLLLNYLKNKYDFYYVSSTTKVILDFNELIDELNNDNFTYVVPDFRLNKDFKHLNNLNNQQKDKIEFLCNECCNIACIDRKACYENVSHLNLGDTVEEFKCKYNESYKFSKAKLNKSFISLEDIKNLYLPMGFSNFKIEGRGLGSALLLEFILYYMVKEEYQLNVREEMYLDNTLDLF